MTSRDVRRHGLEPMLEVSSGAMSAKEHIELAKKHLARVQGAWNPPDWPDLALYGFYCLENAVMAAAIHTGITTQKTHPAKANAAQELAAEQGLVDVSSLLRQLNDARKAEAYGDVDRPDLDPEVIAREVEAYVESVEKLLAR